MFACKELKPELRGDWSSSLNQVSGLFGRLSVDLVEDLFQ